MLAAVDLYQVGHCAEPPARNTLQALATSKLFMNLTPDLVSLARAIPSLRPTAAIAAQSAHVAEEIIDAVVRELQQDGRQVVGFCQRQADDGNSQARCRVELQSIRTGQHHAMTQQLGSGSISCNVDPEAIELLAVALCNELSESVDLVVINRFGKRESQGAGFRSVIEAAMELQLPVLTVVKDTWQDNWRDYGGEWVSVLPADFNTVMHWYQEVSARARRP